MMRRLIRDEGLLCGGSSGSAVSAALEAAATLEAGQNCVVILPDSVRNYMTKALSDDWMIDHNFIDGDIIKKKRYENWWAEKRVCDLDLNTPLTISSNVRCKDAIALLKKEGFDMVPVIDEEGDVVGVVTEGNMSTRIISGRATPETSVKEAGVIYKTFRKLSMNAKLADLAAALDMEPYGTCLVLHCLFLNCFYYNSCTSACMHHAFYIVNRNIFCSRDVHK
jgi:cystathionine beta-synthase